MSDYPSFPGGACSGPPPQRPFPYIWPYHSFFASYGLAQLRSLLFDTTICAEVASSIIDIAKCLCFHLASQGDISGRRQRDLVNGVLTGNSSSELVPPQADHFGQIVAYFSVKKRQDGAAQPSRRPSQRRHRQHNIYHSWNHCDYFDKYVLHEKLETTASGPVWPQTPVWLCSL